MKIEILNEIITDNQEDRMEGNGYSLEKEGYHVYILDKKISIKKTKESHPFGKAIITSLIWKNGYTFITYELTSLNGVN